MVGLLLAGGFCGFFSASCGDSAEQVAKFHEINLLQAEIALHELAQVSRQQVLNLIAPDVTDDGWLAAQGPFDPYMLIAEAATRELSKSHVGYQLHTRFPALHIKGRSARNSQVRLLTR